MHESLFKRGNAFRKWHLVLNNPEMIELGGAWGSWGMGHGAWETTMYSYPVFPHTPQLCIRRTWWCGRAEQTRLHD